MTLSLDSMRQSPQWPQINKLEKNNNDLMQECCIRFIMFGKFSPVRRNNSRQSIQR